MTKKKSAAKKTVTAIKKAATKSKTLPSALKKSVKHVAPKKAVVKKATPEKQKAASKPIEDTLAKEALKLVDKASDLLRSGIKNSHKTTTSAREKAHKEVHSLLGKATRHLDDALKTGSSFLKKAIDKI